MANELADSIERLARFLRDHNESFWADKLDQDAVWIRQDDRYGVDRFLTHFGGMGSLNDLVFGEAPLNERFRALKEDAWTQADDARHA